MTAALLLGLASLLPTTHARAEGTLKPTIVLERELHIGDTTLAVSALDVEGTSLDNDWAEVERGTKLSVYLTRGPLQKPDEQGLIQGRRFYNGELVIEIETPGRAAPESLRFSHANHPISAQHPSIYQRRIPLQLQAGDMIRVLPVEGYLPKPVEIAIADVGARASLSAHAGYFFSALLLFSALLSFALAVPTRLEKQNVAAANTRQVNHG